jgi:hypothetical protein
MIMPVTFLSFKTVALSSVALLAAGSAALAAPRPDVSQMSCEQARDLIAQSGARVVTTGPNTYKRFVARGGYCDPGERYLHPAWTPTADQKSCRIGYTCETWNLYFSERDRD